VSSGPAFDRNGGGPPVVLIHAGIADRRMWEPQWTSLADAFTLLRFDLRGFGDVPLGTEPVCHGADVVAVLDAAGVGRAALVGASLGGRVALEVAVAAPDRVSALVLADPGLPGHPRSAELAAFGEALDVVWEAGDLDAAAALAVRFWVDRPGRAAPPEAAVVALVTAMTRRAFGLEHAAGDVESVAYAPALADRLGEGRAPTLVVCGDEDVADLRAISARLAAEIPNATLVDVPGAAHLPSLEQPVAFEAAVRPFLERVLAPGRG
jgi:pimeloyl-ACP methyl ester carboxylesterase